MRSPALLLVVLFALCALVALSGCGGGTGDGGGAARRAHLYQTEPGQDPVIRMGWSPSGATDPSKIVAWLIYRGTSFGLAAEDANLTDVLESHGSIDYEDTAAGAVASTFSRSFTYFRLSTQETGSVAITYSHPALVKGSTYYYRARLVVKPHSSSPPISTAAATTFTVDPADALTDASNSQGPVTYIGAPVQSAPPSGSTAISPSFIQFNWNTVAGADEYQIRVYSNSSATGTPLVQSPVIIPTSGFGNWTYNAGSSLVLRGGTTYYWFVGARAAGETTPSSGTEDGWLRSLIRPFTTVTLPPGV